MIDHPLLAAMPTCSAESYRRIKRSVERYGLRERIPVYRGQKLDGRALDQICDELGIPEDQRYVEISAEDLSEEEVAERIMSGKLDRAHWTAGQVNVAIDAIPQSRTSGIDDHTTAGDAIAKRAHCGWASSAWPGDAHRGRIHTDPKGILRLGYPQPRSAQGTLYHV